MNSGNAIKNSQTPHMDSLMQNHLFTPIMASGLSVGLPEGIMGNSEVGHLTMGAGRINFQDLVRINRSMDDGSISKNPELVRAFERAKRHSDGIIQFLGLISDGGVHSHQRHLEALINAADAFGLKSFVHVFADGRDTKPTSAVGYIQQLQQFCLTKRFAKIATVQGRYYGMDRDKRWDRIRIGFRGLIGVSFC